MGFWNAVNLSFTLAKADFKLKNEGSYLGILWYLVNPILTFVLLSLIFYDRLGNYIPHYLAYVFFGVIMFNLLQKTLLESCKVIFANPVIKSIHFSRGSLVGAIVLKNMFSHFFEVALLLVLLVVFNIPIYGLIFYVFILALFSIFLFGSALILSSTNMYLLDLENIWLFLSSLLFFATPIFYTFGGQVKLFYLNLFNPLYFFISLARDYVLYSDFSRVWILFGAIFYTLLFLLVGLLFFNKLKGKFAELI